MVLKFERYNLLIFLKVGLIVPLCIFLFIAGCGYFFGGTSNLNTAILSWFVTIPLLTVLLSMIISGHGNLAFKSLVSLMAVYGIMIFMTYKHYQTDFFQIMIASLVFNSMVMALSGVVTRRGRNEGK